MNHHPTPLLTSCGNENLAAFLVEHKLATHDAVTTAMISVQRRNAAGEGQPAGAPEGQRVAASLLMEIGKAGADIEDLISAMIDHTKLPFVPLDCYEVDRHIVKTLPECLTLGRLMVPFDIVGRAIMVAVENPFDSEAIAAVQEVVDYHVMRFLAHPLFIRRILCETYRVSD